MKKSGLSPLLGLCAVRTLDFWGIHLVKKRFMFAYVPDCTECYAVFREHEN